MKPRVFITCSRVATANYNMGAVYSALLKKGPNFYNKGGASPALYSFSVTRTKERCRYVRNSH